MNEAIFILILTFSYTGPGAGAGGVAMQEFSSLENCRVAGHTWQKNYSGRYGSSRNNVYRYENKNESAYYLCVKK